MKRRFFLQGVALAPPLLLQACLSNPKPIPPTIFTGFVTDENGIPIKDFEFYFGGNTGGFNPKSTFEKNTKTDEKGYYYLEQIVNLDITVDVTFKASGNIMYTSALYDFLCLVKGIYQSSVPFIVGTKNEFNFKIVKRK